MESMTTNSFKAWILAARPKTLSGAAVPVIVGLALAFSDILSSGAQIQWFNNGIPALLCLLFALLMQVDANFINDYFDCLKGTDREDRLGPKRACAEGWITLSAMKQGILLTTIASCLIGLPLIYFGGWNMVWIGLFCVIFAFLYTTKLSYLGLGDVLVVIFFGLVPVATTYYLQLSSCDPVIPSLTWEALLAGLIVGLVTDNLLIVNNFRDREQDKISGKNTLIIKIGANWSQRLYLGIGILAVFICFTFLYNGHLWASILPCLYLVPHIKTWKKMVQIWQGKLLNEVLGATARNILIFGLLLAAGFIL